MYLTAAFCFIAVIAATATASISNSTKTSPQDYPSPWYILITLRSALTYGASLKGKQIKDLRTGKYNREASGGVHNFLKWPAIVEQIECPWGRINVPLRTVKDGFVEGFASHKASDTATGTQVRYSLTVDDDIFLHFMYSVPYDFTWYENTLAVATCPRTNQQCRELTAEKMYQNDYPFLKRKGFYYDINPVGVCYDSMCVLGWMFKDHTPSIFILLLPRNYYDLDEKVRAKIPDITTDVYQWFIKTIFQ